MKKVMVIVGLGLLMVGIVAIIVMANHNEAESKRLYGSDTGSNVTDSTPSISFFDLTKSNKVDLTKDPSDYDRICWGLMSKDYIHFPYLLGDKVRVGSKLNLLLKSPRSAEKKWSSVKIVKILSGDQLSRDLDPQMVQNIPISIDNPGPGTNLIFNRSLSKYRGWMLMKVYVTN